MPSASSTEWMVTMTVPPHHSKYVNILHDLRTEFTTPEQRQALMAAVYEEFSERNLADVLADVFEQDRHVILAEAIESYSRLRCSPSVLQMRQVLAKCGWDFDDGPNLDGPH